LGEVAPDARPVVDDHDVGEAGNRRHANLHRLHQANHHLLVGLVRGGDHVAVAHEISERPCLAVILQPELARFRVRFQLEQHLHVRRGRDQHLGDGLLVNVVGLEHVDDALKVRSDRGRRHGTKGNVLGHGQISVAD
jgi:hypothetical protein